MSKLATDYFIDKGWKYCLQGSRSKVDIFHFADVKKSDWDYFLDDAQHANFPAYSQLVKDGWKELDTEAYQDASTSRVFEKDFPDGKVQVSLRYEFDYMVEAWGSVHSGFYWKYLNKRSENYLGKDFARDFMDMLYYSSAYK